MKILLVFNKTTEQKCSQHNFWEDAWDVYVKHPTFDDTNQVALLLNKPTDLVDPGTGNPIYPENYDTAITYDYIYKPFVSADNTPPASPTALAATPGDTTISLTWENPTDPDFSKIIIRRASGSIYPPTVYDGIGVLEDTTPPSSYVGAGLTNGQEYSYSVFSADALGNVSSPATVSVTPSV